MNIQIDLFKWEIKLHVQALSKREQSPALLYLDAGLPTQRKNDAREHKNSSLHDSHAELVRAIQEEGEKECFATDLRYVCVDFHCRWQDDCHRLSAR